MNKEKLLRWITDHWQENDVFAKQSFLQARDANDKYQEHLVAGRHMGNQEILDILRMSVKNGEFDE